MPETKKGKGSCHIIEGLTAMPSPFLFRKPNKSSIGKIPKSLKGGTTCLDDEKNGILFGLRCLMKGRLT